MNQYLIDVNLPKYFKFFNKPEFSFVIDISLTFSDTKIWEYAVEKNLIIITKDTDFYYRSLIASIKPKVVYISLGNISLKQLNSYFTLYWHIIEEALHNHYLIVVKEEGIDAFL